MLGFAPLASAPIAGTLDHGTTLSPSLFSNTQTFHGATISTGAVSLSPSLFTNNQTFHAATVSPGTVALSPSLYSNDNTIYAPAVVGGAIDLQPPLLTSGNVIYLLTAASVNTIVPQLLTDTNTFYGPTIPDNRNIKFFRDEPRRPRTTVRSRGRSGWL